MAGGDRYLAAIMFTDLVGYSAMMRRDEALALELLEEHWTLLRPLFPEFGGREVKTIGDAFLVEFQSALKAVQCGVAMQSLLANRNLEHPDDEQIRLRIGIHMGDVESRGGDVFGDGVNIAARVEPQAESGGICITETVFQQVQNKVTLNYRDLGTKDLKNVGPVRLFSIPPPGGSVVEEPEPREVVETHKVRALRRVVAATLVIGFAALAIWGALVTYPLIFDGDLFETTPSNHSLMVLPFANNSPDPGNDYVANGLTDELRIRLRGVEGLLVASKSASRRYRSADPAADRSDSGITAILDGSIQRSGDRLRVSAELIDVATGIVTWSKSYDRQFEDYLDVQIELATAVAEALRGALAANGVQGIATLPTADVSAYDLYLQAMDHLNQRTDIALDHASELFEEVTQIDPGMVQAHAGLATALLLREPSAEMSADELTERASNAVDRATALDPDRTEVQAALGLLLGRTNRPAAAETALLRAIELDELNLDAYRWLGDLYAELGRPADEYAIYEQGLEVDPEHVGLNVQTAETYAKAGDHGRAALIYEHLLDIDPTDQVTYLDRLATTLSEAGEVAGAIEWYTEIIRVMPYSRDARASAAYWLLTLGEDDAAEAMVDGCLELSPNYGRCRATSSLLDFYRGELDLEPTTDRTRQSVEYRVRGLAALRQGEPQTAVRWFWRLRDRMPRGVSAGLDSGYPSTTHEIMALNQAERPDDAAARLNQFKFIVDAALSADRGQSASAHYTQAQLSAIVGDTEHAVAALKQAFTRGWRNARFARLDPALATVIQHPDVELLLDAIDDGAAAARGTLDLDELATVAGTISAEAVALAPQQLVEYVGFYEWDAYTIASIHITDGQLFERRTDGKDVALTPIGDDRFYSPEEFFTVRFERGPVDEITHFVFETEDGDNRRVRRIDLPPTIVVSGDRLDDYVGWYQAPDRPDQLVTILRDGDALIEETTGQPRLTLRAIAEDVFEYDPMEFVARSTFERDETGQVVRIIFHEGHGTTVRERIPEQTLVTQDAALARRMEGRYLSVDAGLSFQVISSGDQLEIRWAPAGNPWRKSSWYELFPAGDGRYFFDDEQLVAEIQFALPATGPATSLMIEFGDGELWEATRD